MHQLPPQKKNSFRIKIWQLFHKPNQLHSSSILSASSDNCDFFKSIFYQSIKESQTQKNWGNSMIYQSIKNHNYPPDPFNLGVSLNGGTPPISHPQKGSFLVGVKPMEIVGYSTTICRKTFPPNVGFTDSPPTNLHQRHRISCSFFEAPNPAPQQGLKS